MKRVLLFVSLLIGLSFLQELPVAMAQAPQTEEEKVLEEYYNSLTPKQRERAIRVHELQRTVKTLQEKKKHREVIAVCEELVSPTLRTYSYYRDMAEAYTALGENANAIKTYRTLLYPAEGKNWDAGFGDAQIIRMNFALLLNQAGLYEEALANYQEGIKQVGDPKAPWIVHLNQGGGQGKRLTYSIHLVLGMEKRFNFDWNEVAIGHIRQALKVSPKSAIAWFCMTMLYETRQYRSSEDAKAYQEARQKFVEYADKKLREQAATFLKIPITEGAPSPEGTRAEP